MTLNILIGVWILAKRPDMWANRWFFGLTVLIAAWGLAEAMIIMMGTPEAASSWERFSGSAGLFIPFAGLSFLMSFLREALGKAPGHFRAIQISLLLIGAAMIPVNCCTNLLNGDVILTNGMYRTAPGPLFIPFALFVLLGIAYPFGFAFLKSFGIEEKFLRSRLMILGLAPIAPAVLYLFIEAIPAVSTGARDLGIYPSTLVFTLILGTASNRLRLMTVTPQSAALDILESQPDGLMLVDARWRIRHLNNAGIKLLNVDPQAAAARRGVAEILSINSKGYEGIFGSSFESLPDKISLRGEAHKSADSPIPVTLTIQKVSESSEIPGGAIIVIRDERPLRELEAGLIHSEKIKSLGVMAAGLAHELNNPLTAIIGYSELGIGNETMEPGQAGSYFQTINQQAKRAYGIIRNMLDFAGSSFSFGVPVSVNEIVESMVRIRKHEIEVKEHKVALSLSDDVPATICDAQKLKQVVFNIFDNAIHAVDDANRPGVIKVGTRMEMGQIVISIEDTGTGIAPEILPRIFDPFFTTRAPGRGAGLGLSMAHALAAEMGGKIEAQTEQGRGSLFSLRLPVVQYQGQRKKPTTESLLGQKLQYSPGILIIDRDKPLVGLMAEALSLKGCKVETAEWPPASGAPVGKGFDVLLVDAGTAGLQARDLRDLLASSGPGAESRTIAFASDDFPGHEKESLAKQGVRFMDKPFRIRELIEKVIAVLAETYAPGSAAGNQSPRE